MTMELSAEEDLVCSEVEFSDYIYADVLTHFFRWKTMSKTETIQSLQGILTTDAGIDQIKFFLKNLASISTTERLKSRTEATRTLRDEILAANDAEFYGASEELGGLIYAMISRAGTKEVWKSIICFSTANSRLFQSKNLPAQDDEVPEFYKKRLQRLFHHWNTAFCGHSLLALEQKLMSYERQNPDSYYAKTLSIVQSSGTGKSRLADEISKKQFAVSFALRYNGESGYPPGDPEVCKFLGGAKSLLADRAMEPHTRIATCHAYALGLLFGIFTEAKSWLTADKKDHPSDPPQVIAKRFHTAMAPVLATADLRAEKQLSDLFAQTRSGYKKGMCARIVRTAEKKATNMLSNVDWTGFFKAREQDSIMYETITELLPVRELLKLALSVCTMIKTNQENEQSLFLLVFDEASQLFDGRTDELFTALRRMLNALQGLPAEDRSSRIYEGTLRRFDAFYGLQLDLGMVEMIDNDLDAVKKIPLSKFATGDHMTKYGRPLWAMYKDDTPSGLRNLALAKLLNGIRSYDPRNENHVLAALAARVSLDPCTNNVDSSAKLLVRNAVDSHLRLIVHMNESTGDITTTTPSEPLISEAVAKELSSDSSFSGWATTIATLTRSLLQPGAIEKGTKGELYVRIICVLARDLLACNTRPVLGENTFYDSEPFCFLKFLDCLFVDDISRQITGLRALGAVRRSPRAETTKDPTLDEAFKNALCNFTHFVHTDCSMEPNKPEITRELLHNLILQHAALQCSHAQPIWDLVLPVYLGDPSAAFDESALTAVLIQIKNQQASTNVWMSQTNYNRYFGPEWKNPVLFLVVNIGIFTAKFDSMESFSSSVYQCTVTGSETVYGPLEHSKQLGTACAQMLCELGKFFEKTVDLDLHQQICNSNVRFHHHTFQKRFFPTWTTKKVPEPTQAAEGQGDPMDED